jgi:hypothetical protein
MVRWSHWPVNVFKLPGFSVSDIFIIAGKWSLRRTQSQEADSAAVADGGAAEARVARKAGAEAGASGAGAAARRKTGESDAEAPGAGAGPVTG